MPPPDQQLLEEIAELGREFTRLGWTPRLAPLREFYAAARAGRPQTERWSVSHLARLRAALGLGAAPLVVSVRCPSCSPPVNGQWAGARTVLHFEDRWVNQCALCSTEWVTFCSAEKSRTNLQP